MEAARIDGTSLKGRSPRNLSPAGKNGYYRCRVMLYCQTNEQSFGYDAFVFKTVSAHCCVELRQAENLLCKSVSIHAINFHVLRDEVRKG